MREGVAESDARRGGFDQFAGARAVKHAGLSSHDGTSLYTGGREKGVESRKLKVKITTEERRKEGRRKEEREDNAETQSALRSAERPGRNSQS